MPVPSYEDVLDTYNIEILRPGADLQVTPNGSPALTNDGHLKLGNDQFNAMFRLVHAWRFTSPTLEALFNLVALQKEERRRLVHQRNDLTAAIQGILDTAAIDKFQALNDQIGAAELSCGVCAGAIVVALSNLLLRFKTDLQANEKSWGEATPLFEGHSVGSVIQAAANNFRHYDEWARIRRTAKEEDQQRRSIEILAALLKKPTDWVRANVCPQIIEVLSGATYEQLNRNCFDFAKNLARH